MSPISSLCPWAVRARRRRGHGCPGPGRARAQLKSHGAGFPGGSGHGIQVVAAWPKTAGAAARLEVAVSVTVVTVTTEPVAQKCCSSASAAAQLRVAAARSHGDRRPAGAGRGRSGAFASPSYQCGAALAGRCGMSSELELRALSRRSCESLLTNSESLELVGPSRDGPPREGTCHRTPAVPDHCECREGPPLAPGPRTSGLEPGPSLALRAWDVRRRPGGL